jgi:DNA polymerase III sliding clamp (beta) subunit (PCNA family)
MKCSINLKDLASKVDFIHRLAPNTGHFQEARYMYLSTKDATLTASAHNSVQEATATLPVTGDEGGELLVDARRFYSLIRALLATNPDGEMLELNKPEDGQLLRISCAGNTVKLHSLATNNWTFFTNASREWFSIDSQLFCSALAMCASAAGENVLAGINLVSDGADDLHMAASDGRFMITRTVKTPEEIAGGNVVLPDEAVPTIKRAFEGAEKLDFSLDGDDAVLTMCSDDLTVVKSRLLASEYPDTRATLKQAEALCEAVFVIKTGFLRKALQRLKPVMTPQGRTCLLASRHETLNLVVSSPSVGEALETIPAVLPEDNGLYHYLNVDFLDRILKACAELGEEVQIQWNRGKDPLLIYPVMSGEENGSLRCMLMPMQKGANDPVYKEVLEW